MNWWSNARAGLAAGLLLAGLLAGAWGQVTPGRMEKFRIPEYDDQGQLKSRVTGDTAEVQPDGKVKISNVRVEIYRDGKLDAVVWAAGCVFDQKDRSIVSDTDVRLERYGAVIRGKGLRWDNVRQYAEILSQVRVELRHANLWTPKEPR